MTIFYTALFGGVDILKEFDTGGYDFVAYTDKPVASKTWKIVYRDPAPPGLSPRHQSKLYKMDWLAPLAPTRANDDDEIVIWIDASIIVTDVEKMVSVCRRAVEDGGHDIAFFMHPERTNIYDEMQASAVLPKYADQNLYAQVEAYRNEGLPDDHGLYAGGVIARRYGKMKELLEAWKTENRRTIQDQLSLPYVLWKCGVTPGVIPGSVYGTDFHKHVWAGPEDKPQRRATDLCMCGETYDKHLAGHPGAPLSMQCAGFIPHPQPRLEHAMRTGEEAALVAEAIPEPIVTSAASNPLVSVITPTHNPVFIRDCWRSLEAQTYKNFEWIITPNHESAKRQTVDVLAKAIRATVGDDPRIRIVEDLSPFNAVGARKQFAFGAAAGDILVEYDHDDILVPTALAEIVDAFKDPEVGFVYSDSIDFVEGDQTLQGNQTYRSPAVRPGWESVGFTFYEQAIKGFRAGKYECVRWHDPSAWMVSHIGTAPNHVRAWRRSVYEAIGGHNPLYRVCDDHELVLRTYLATRFHHIQKPLYLQRITGWNTWLQNIGEINNVSNNLRAEYLERLVLRECELLGLPVYDLGGGLYPRAGWTPVDKEFERNPPYPTFTADLAVAPWPWLDNSVGAFRASDLLEHLPDKMQTMHEIHRCLRPGGWLLSMTPSALGWGAFSDPTHSSFWVPQSFWPFTRDQQAQYIRAKALFREVHLDTVPIIIQGIECPYVRADIVKLPAWRDLP